MKPADSKPSDETRSLETEVVTSKQRRIEPVEVRLRPDETLYVRLGTKLTKEHLELAAEEIRGRLDPEFEFDMILDFTNVGEIDASAHESLRDLFTRLREGSERRIAAMTNLTTGMTVSSIVFGGGFRAAIVHTLDEAVTEIARRRTEGS